MNVVVLYVREPPLRAQRVCESRTSMPWTGSTALTCIDNKKSGGEEGRGVDAPETGVSRVVSK